MSGLVAQTSESVRTTESLWAVALVGTEKLVYFVILSEAKNLSFFVFLYLNRREILRFAQNDKIITFSLACLAAETPDFSVLTQTLQPVGFGPCND